MASAPSSSSPTSGLGRAALIGVAAGMRSAMPFAGLAARGRIAPASSRGRRVAFLAAGGELIGDKLPATPARTEPGPLGGRIASGAIAGTFVGGAAGAAAGAAGGLVGSYVFQGLRGALTERLPVPPVVVALLEDAVAVALVVVATGEAS